MNRSFWNKCSSWLVSSSLLVVPSSLSCSSSEFEESLSSTSSSLDRYSPLSPIRIFRPNSNLEIAFDVRTRNPLYVLERLVVPQQQQGNYKRKRHHFYEEKKLPEVYRSRNASYHLSGYDRGHLAPAADFGDDKDQVLDTYNLCNISPQNPRLNSKAWAQLEDWTRRVAARFSSYSSNSNNNGGDYCDWETYVVTGPIWLPNRMLHDKLFEFHYPAIGSPPNLVAVPTHFFKLIVVIQRQRQRDYSPATTTVTASSSRNTTTTCDIRHFACFVFPNRDVTTTSTTASIHSNNTNGYNNGNDRSSWSLEDGLVRWTDLEAVTGLEFFTELVDRDWKLQADEELVVHPRRISWIGQKNDPPLLLLPSGDSGTSSDQFPSSMGTRSAGSAAPKKTQQHPFSSSSSNVSHLCPNGSCLKYYSANNSSSKRSY